MYTLFKAYHFNRQLKSKTTILIRRLFQLTQNIVASLSLVWQMCNPSHRTLKSCSVDLACWHIMYILKHSHCQHRELTHLVASFCYFPIVCSDVIILSRLPIILVISSSKQFFFLFDLFCAAFSRVH